MKAHRSLDRLIVDMLAYDVLVFPCPDDDAEFDRWERNGWDPGLLARRVSQLGDHAVVTPWDPWLRQVWESTWQGLPAEDRDDPEVPLMLAETVMADLSMATLMGAADDRFGQTVLEQPQIDADLRQRRGLATGEARAARVGLGVPDATRRGRSAWLGPWPAKPSGSRSMGIEHGWHQVATALGVPRRGDRGDLPAHPGPGAGLPAARRTVVGVGEHAFA